MVGQARQERVGTGLAPVTPGWFVVNARDGVWLTNERFGSVCIFESDEWVLQGRPELDEQPFPQAGINLRVLAPGQSVGFFHAETADQEDFLVLQGECTLVVEEHERTLRAWDFVHCPAGTAHVFVGAGDGPCVLLAAGGRSGNSTTVYRRSDLATRHRASVETETTSSAEAYAGLRDWRHERPPAWNELPWAGVRGSSHEFRAR